MQEFRENARMMSGTTSSGSSNTSSSSNGFKIVSIEGNIGSGKSTLLAHLRKTFENYSNIIFLKEPVDDWESIKDNEGKTMIQKFYADQERYSFSFQMMAYISRLALLKTAIKENPNAIIITERSLYTDKYVFAKMLFESGKIEDVNYQIYSRWFVAFAEECPVDKVIYVNADPEICHERIARRSRMGEDVIPLEYLQQCHEYHENMIHNIMHSQEEEYKRQLILNGNINIFSHDDQLKKWVRDIHTFIGIGQPFLDIDGVAIEY